MLKHAGQLFIRDTPASSASSVIKGPVGRGIHDADPDVLCA